MTLLTIVCGLWSFDRVEPPHAVLVGCGQTVDVPRAQLPADARPGDLLETPRGPVLPGREAREQEVQAMLSAALAARSDLLAVRPTESLGLCPAGPDARCLASGARVGQVADMGRRDHRNDHFARQAQRDGYRARSVYKLQEIDQKVRLLRSGQRVLDLGCAPGSWTQFAAKRVGGRGRVVGIDLQTVEPIPGGQVTLLKADAFAADPEVLTEAAGGPFDVVLSDMAPATTGDRFSDHVRSVELCRRALGVAQAVLKPPGAFVCKVFEGEDANDFVAEVKRAFTKVRRIKPKGTRSQSVEFFVVAQDLRIEQGDSP